MIPYVVAAPFATLLVLWLVYRISSGRWNPYEIVRGADRRPSTSLAQIALWTVVVLPCYAAIWTANWRGGHMGGLGLPANLLAVLGIATSTAVGARALYLVGDATTPEVDPNAPRGGLVTDDFGDPELVKIQLLGWTLLAIGIFCIGVIHTIRVTVGYPGHPPGSLPDIDAALLTLMGISHAGYFGKRAVDRKTPKS